MSFPPEKIVEAAKKAGFDTELRVAAILNNAGWRANQNVYFIDKDENKGRELDILSYKIFNSLDKKPELSCLINLCIEVKKTADPFIFYTNEPTGYEGGSGYGLFNWNNNINNKVLPYQEIEHQRPFRKPQRIARSYSNKDGKTSHIQSGVISAFKAAIYEKDTCKEVYSDFSGDICFFIPIVVVEGQIFECYYKAGAEELTAEQVDYIVYKQNYQSSNYGRVTNNVFVMNMAGFAAALPHFSAWGEHMLSTMIRNRHIVQKLESS